MTLRNDANKITAKIKFADTLIKLNLFDKANLELDSLRFDRMQLLRRLSREEWSDYLRDSAKMKDRL